MCRESVPDEVRLRVRRAGAHRWAASAIVLSAVLAQGWPASAAPMQRRPEAAAHATGPGGVPITAPAPSPETSAPAPCEVPDLRGRTLLQVAYHHLLDGLVAGSPRRRCRLGRVTRRHPRRGARGQPLVVVSQSPRAGAVVPYLTPVSLVLAPARPKTPGRCRLPAGSDVVARTAGMLVYRTFAGAGVTSVDTIIKATWRACLRRSGVRRTIYEGADGLGVSTNRAGRFAVAGDYVAHTIDVFEYKYTGGSGRRMIAVFDVARGKRTFDELVGTAPGSISPLPPPAFPEVPVIVVNARGFVAWLTRDPTGASLYAHDARGARQLDRLAGGTIANLRLRGDTLTWTSNATPRTATLT